MMDAANTLEQALIGAVLIDRKCIDLASVKEGIFADLEHKRIWTAIETAAAEGELDVVAVYAKLDSNESELLAYLGKCANEATPRAAPTYLRRLTEIAQEREVRELTLALSVAEPAQRPKLIASLNAAIAATKVGDTAQDAAERVIVGALVVAPELYAEVEGIVDRTLILDPERRAIFECAVSMMRAGKTVDAVSVTHELHQSGARVAPGLPELLANTTAPVASLRPSAEILRAKSVERKAAAQATAFLSGSGPLAERAMALADAMAVAAQESTDRALPKGRKFSEIVKLDRIRFQYALPGLRVGNVGVFAGYGGTGKGFLGIALAVDTALGEGVMTGLDIQGSPSKVVFVSIEDDQEALDARLQSFAEHLTAEQIEILDKNLRVVSVYGLPNWQLLQRGDRNALVENHQAITSIIEACKDGRLLILDTARKFFAFDENKSDEASLALYVCDQIARRAGPAVILVHHLAKPANSKADEMPNVFDIRGSSALVADARWAAVLATPNQKMVSDRGLNQANARSYRVLDIGKANHGAAGGPMLFLQDRNGVLKSEPWPAQIQKAQVVDIRRERGGVEVVNEAKF